MAATSGLGFLISQGRFLYRSDYIIVGQRPWHMALSPDGAKLYTVNGFTNDVTVVDVKSLKPEVSVHVGRLPWGIAVVP